MIPVIDFKKGNFGPDKLAKVFSDTCAHIGVAKMIQAHLSNKNDIRKLALQSLDLSSCKKILDVGCGFGYFTQGLEDRIHPNAEVLGIDIHPAYENHYLKTCKKANLKGKFIGDGIAEVTKFPEKSFDLILSSFSFYFFPEYIGRIASLLKNDGICVAITHAVPHMHELTSFVKALLHLRGIGHSGDLPYESLIRNFSSENGKELLNPWFSDIQRQYCKSSLVFPDGDYDSLLKYFKFKHRFFLTENKNRTDELIGLLLEKVKKEMKLYGKFTITKDDIIFVCTQPKPTQPE